MDLISFYADNALIKKATSAEETPTPGYLYHEIVGITHKSVEACQNLENVLMSRLENESAIVKLKTLRTIKHILLKGHVTVKRDLMGRVASIRPALHARGPPDPLRGDALWQSVRTEAQDVINIIFDTEQRATNAPVAVSSMGSDHIGTRNFGNSGNNNNNNNTYTSPNSNYESANANYISSSSARNYSSGPGSSSSSSSSSSSFAETGAQLTQDIKNKISSLPGKLMGNSRPSGELSNFGSLNAAVSHAATHSYTSPNVSSDWAYAPPTVTSQNTDEESGLVDDITNSGGSSSLSFQALEQFCARSGLLDLYKIAELLVRKLESRTWQVRHKALSAIESLLLSSTGSVIRDICIENRTVFESLLGGTQSATREKAKQVLTLLGVSVESLPTPSSTPSPNIAQSTTSLSSPSLFETPIQEHETSAPSPSAPSSMFAGLSMGPSQSPNPESQHVYTPPTTQPESPLISIDNVDGAAEEAAAMARNTSLLSFLEASANVPPSPSLLHDLGSAAPANQNDDSPLISSSPDTSRLSLDITSSFSTPLPATTSSNLIDLSSEPFSSPDILSKFRHNTLNSSSPVPYVSHENNSSLSASQPVSPSSSSFLNDLMEAAPPSSLEELLATPGTFLSPATPTPPSSNNILTNPSSSPFGPPPKVPMVPNAQLKPTPSTIPQSALQHYQHQQLHYNAPPQPAPATIKTTSATSVFNPIYSVPRAVSSPSPSSSASSFNFVQQKKGDAFGDLVSIQIKQMGSK